MTMNRSRRAFMLIEIILVTVAIVLAGYCIHSAIPFFGSQGDAVATAPTATPNHPVMVSVHRESGPCVVVEVSGSSYLKAIIPPTVWPGCHMFRIIVSTTTHVQPTPRNYDFFPGGQP